MNPSQSHFPNRIYPSRYSVRRSKPGHEFPHCGDLPETTASPALFQDGWTTGHHKAGWPGYLFNQILSQEATDWLTLRARRLGDGTRRHYVSSPFGRTCKLSLLVLSILAAPWAVIEINEACCCYITLLIPSARKETDEDRINSLLESS